jgi:preprotein translocase subunit SecF
MAGTGSRGGLFGRLYRGETNVNFVGSRKKWYAASALIILICLASIIFRQFNFGIDFKGGDSYQLPRTSQSISVQDMSNAVGAVGVTVASAQTVGSPQNFLIRTPNEDLATQNKVKRALAAAGHVNPVQVTSNTVSKSWGGEVTNQALWALFAFLVAVTIFIWIRFQEWRMAAAALLALLHDLILTAGVYSIVGFEVTPSTVVGLLTILGFSLYDTVVVFDKVSENARGLLSSMRLTYPEAANLAVNQTLMRSINTSIIGLLPVAGLLFVGAGVLGVGTLEDLALVLFVGMITGAYSSLFLATPWLVDFKLLDPRYKNHQQRVLARRVARKSETDTSRRAVAATTDDVIDSESDDEPAGALAASAVPRVGAKPPTKRTGTQQRQRPAANRPGAKRR